MIFNRNYENQLVPIEPEKKGPEQFDPMTRYVGMGRPGNTGYWGYALTGEQVNKLDGRAGLLMFDQMRRGDSQIKSILHSIMLPILSANFYMEPASIEPADVQRAEILEEAILRGMIDPWIDTLRHILLFLPFGFSYLEKVYQYRNGLALPLHLAPRLPLSIYRWMTEMDTGRLYEIWQLDTKGMIYRLPVEKLVMFISEREGDNWTGTSILRPAYKNWLIKNELEKIDAMKHERHGVGVPMVTPRDGAKPNTEEWAAANAAVQQYMAGESTGIVLPFGYKMEILTPGNNGGTDIVQSISYHNEEIAASVLAMFTSLGRTSTGSRALGDTFLHIFLDSIQWYADYICERLTLDLVKECTRMNWGDVPYPKLKCSRIEKLPTDTLAALTTAGLLTPDGTLEDAIRKSLQLPERAVAQIAAPNTAGTTEETDKPQAATGTTPAAEQPISDAQHPQAPAMPQPAAQESGGATVGLAMAERPAAGGAPRPVGEHGAGCTCAEHQAASGDRGLALAKRQLPQREHEYCRRFFDAASYSVQLAGSSSSLRTTLLDLRDRQAAAIKEQLLAGKKIVNIVVPLKKEMQQALVKAYVDQREVGRSQVRNELGRQGIRLASDVAVPPAPGEQPAGWRSVAQGSGQTAKAAAPAPGTPRWLQIVEDEQVLAVNGSANKLASEIAKAYLDGLKQGLEDSELKGYVEFMTGENISDVTWEAMADATIGTAWNDGRESEAQAAIDAGEVETAHYTPVFDGNACEVCMDTYDAQEQDENGDGFHAAGNADFQVPNPGCLGNRGTGNLCRCINIYISGAPMGAEPAMD